MPNEGSRKIDRLPCNNNVNGGGLTRLGRSAGHRQPAVGAEGGAPAAARSRGPQARPLLGVRRRHAGAAALLLHARSALAGVRLVLHRPLGRRRWPAVLLALEVSQRHASAVRLRLVQRICCAGTCARTFQEDDVCDRALLHDDLHDLGGLRQRRCRNRQREDLHHLHDDRGRLETLLLLDPIPSHLSHHPPCCLDFVVDFMLLLILLVLFVTVDV